jgi:hypothetical protein
LTDIERAYVAGLFDGEGCVSFTYTKRGGGDKAYGKLWVRITNTDRDVLDWVRSTFGSGTAQSAGHRDDTTKRRQAYNFVAASEQARLFLAEIYPYLRIKRGQVEELLLKDSTEVRRRKKI